MDESVEFFPAAFDDGPKRVLGKTAKFDVETAIDHLLEQPAAPKFIAWKMLKEFIHPQPLAEHVDHYAGRLIEHKWEIKPVVVEMLTSRLFFSDYAYRSKIKSPCELVVGSPDETWSMVAARLTVSVLSKMREINCNAVGLSVIAQIRVLISNTGRCGFQ